LDRNAVSLGVVGYHISKHAHMSRLFAISRAHFHYLLECCKVYIDLYSPLRQKTHKHTTHYKVLLAKITYCLKLV